MAKLLTYVGALTASISPFTNSSTGSGSASIVSSAFEINTGSGSDTGAAYLDNTFGVDVDESAGYLEMLALPTGGRCDVAWVDASENGYRIRWTSTQFTWSRLAGGTPTTLSGPTTWSSASHRWFRIREASGTTYLEMAPDSGSGSPGTWSTLYSEATTTPGWTHTAIDKTFFAPAAVGTGVTRFRYMNTQAPGVTARNFRLPLLGAA